MRGMALAVLAMGLVVGAGPASAADPIESVCAKAASEPALTWYTSQDPARNDAAVAAFKAKYPAIKVEAFRLVTGKLASRYASERDAGVINAGLISLADEIFINDGRRKDWFVEFEKDEMPALQALDKRWFNRGAAVTSITVLGLSFNAKRLPNGPQTWQDLTKPEYKGQILLGDPRSVPSYMALFRILREQYGDAFLKGLAAQNPVLVPSVVPATQQLAAGEVAIVAPNVLAVTDPLAAKGAPVKLVVPELTTGNEFMTVISKGTPSLNAAKCLYNFLFTQDGQVAYSSTTSLSPMGNVPNGLKAPAQYKEPRLTELTAHEGAILSLLGVQ